MAKRPQPAPGAIYECDRLAHPLFLAIRLYANRLEVDMGTTYLHRYKKTEAYKYSALRSLPLEFKNTEDAQEFYNAVNSL